MTVGFKISHRLARAFLLIATAADLSACAVRDTTQPGSPPSVHTIIVSPDSATIAISGTLHLLVELRDSSGALVENRLVSWRSELANIASVSADGMVEGKDSGSTSIVATSEGHSASARVKVNPHGPPSRVPTGFFISPTGTSTNTGTIDRPLDLPTALTNASGRIQPGDTVWLRGGTYHGNFQSHLTGTASKPIVVRQYPGERAIIDGAGVSTTPSTWAVFGQYSVFWGFELTNSDPNRVLADTEKRPNVLANYANHTKFVNLVVHDGGVAFYNESPYYDVEIVGCVIYNEGYQRTDRGHSHAIYIRSNTGPVTARDNIMFNGFGYGVHVFTNPGEGELNNVRIEGNIAFNSGTLSTNSNSDNILFGGDAYSTGGVVKSNYTYESPGVTAKNVQVGYGATLNGSVQVLDNYFAGGGTVLDVGYWSSLTASNNQLMGTATLVTVNDASIPMSTFAGQMQASLPTATKVVLRANPYEQGRANVAVYNWAQESSVSLDLSGIVPDGASYEIRNVQDLFGSPVVSGTYSGGSVILPIRGVTPPVPVGFSSSRAPATGTTFNAYVVAIRR